MVDNRPFVDRRVALVVLFEGGTRTDLEREEESTVKALNRTLDDMGITAYVTDVKAVNNPPQMKIIFSESSIATDTLRRIENQFTSSFEEVGGRIQTVQVVSVALSPGDKVRNAMGV